jgi:signal transduction histidine kinase
LTHYLEQFSTGVAPKMYLENLLALVRNCGELVLAHSLVNYKIIAPGKVWKVECNHAQIERALINLLLNAKEAMPEGGTVHIHLENVILHPEDDTAKPTALSPGHFLKISIKDEGKGIAESDKDKIFDPYFTTKTDVNRKGLGLGLSIVHTIINNHRGHIEMDSVMGKGTLVVVLLPAKGD